MRHKSLQLDHAGFPLLDAIYAAGADFSLWPQALVKLADALGAQDAILGMMSPDGLPVMNFAPRSDPSYMAMYRERYNSQDHIWHRIMAHGAGAILTDEAVSTEAERKRSTIYNEWSRPQSYHTVLGGLLFAQQGWVTGLMLPRQRTYDDDAIRLLSSLSGHVARAVQLNLRLARGECYQAASVQMLQSMPRAAFVLDADGRLLMANPAGEALLQRGGGLYLKEGRLAALASHAQQRLTSLVSSALRPQLVHLGQTAASPGSAGNELLLPPKQATQPPRRLLVSPLRGMPSPEVSMLFPGMACVLIVEAEAPALCATGWLQQRYGLTPAEARLALEMAQGDGKAAAAERLGISFSTARTQLSRIFDKTGVRRQAELVRLIAQLDVHKKLSNQ